MDSTTRSASVPNLSNSQRWTRLRTRASDQIDAAAYAVLEAEEYWGPVKVERVFGVDASSPGRGD